MYIVYIIFIIILVISFITGIILLLLENKSKNKIELSKSIIDNIESILYFISCIFSNGFFFYFYLINSILYKLFPISIFKKQKYFFKEKHGHPNTFLFLILIFVVCICIYTYFYVDKNDIKYVDDTVISNDSKNETNLYRKYGSTSIDKVDFKKLKKVNGDVTAWLMVDGTNINYPIVRGRDNDFYLNHDINKNLKVSGWTFMDYRNDSNLEDDNTIIYGHNLLNKTAFGSLTNLFSDDWYNNSNHYIILLNEDNKYKYEIFSVYEINPEVYYLQTNFYNKNIYEEFLNTIKSRSKYDFNVELNSKDKIITLSTCTDDNKNRRVVHAKRIK